MGFKETFEEWKIGFLSKWKMFKLRVHYYFYQCMFAQIASVNAIERVGLGNGAQLRDFNYVNDVMCALFR